MQQLYANYIGAIGAKKLHRKQFSVENISPFARRMAIGVLFCVAFLF